MAKKKAKTAKSTTATPKPKATAAAMAAGGGLSFFAIMLERYIASNPGELPITNHADTVAALRLIGQHNGTYAVLPRAFWSADAVEPKDLIYSLNGQRDAGRIYRVTEK